MIQIKQLDLDMVRNYKEKLTEYLFICLMENIQNTTRHDAEKYFDNIQKFTEDGSAIVLGAFYENDLVGIQWAYEVDYQGESRLHSSFDFVAPNYQGKGIGTQMMGVLETIAKTRGIHAIEAMCSASNAGAVKYHVRNGFEVERYKLVKKLL